MEKAVEQLKILGYTEKDAIKIINGFGLKNLKSETIIKNIKRNYKFLMEVGYNKEEIIKMTTKSPAIYTYKLENIQEKIEQLQEMGYSKKDIIKMTIAQHSIYSQTIENMQKKIEKMQELGYSKEELIKITKRFPAIYTYSIENIQNKLEKLKELGYSKEEIIKMTKRYPFILGHNLEHMQEKIEQVQELGYSNEEVIKMLKNQQAIYSQSIETIQNKIKQMQKLGYSKEEVIKMTKRFPSLYCISIENMQNKIEQLKELGYSEEEIRTIIKSLPEIYGLSIENIKEKVEFYNSINLHMFVVKNPKPLMQSTALSYARYMFYKEIGINIDETNYRKLFIEQNKFKKQYGISNKEVLNRYDYQKYIAQKSTQLLGKETIQEQEDTEYLNETKLEIEKQEKYNNIYRKFTFNISEQDKSNINKDLKQLYEEKEISIEYLNKKLDSNEKINLNKNSDYVLKNKLNSVREFLYYQIGILDYRMAFDNVNSIEYLYSRADYSAKLQILETQMQQLGISTTNKLQIDKNIEGQIHGLIKKLNEPHFDNSIVKERITVKVNGNKKLTIPSEIFHGTNAFFPKENIGKKDADGKYYIRDGVIYWAFEENTAKRYGNNILKHKLDENDKFICIDDTNGGIALCCQEELYEQNRNGIKYVICSNPHRSDVMDISNYANFVDTRDKRLVEKLKRLGELTKPFWDNNVSYSEYMEELEKSKESKKDIER